MKAAEFFSAPLFRDLPYDGVRWRWSPSGGFPPKRSNGLLLTEPETATAPEAPTVHRASADGHASARDAAQGAAAGAQDATAKDAGAQDAGREVEVKFRCDADGLAACLASPLLRDAAATSVASPGRKLNTVYFDTPDAELQKRRIALRVRRAGRAAPVMTLKWTPDAPEGVFSRGEIELRVPKLQPDLSLLHGEMGDLVRGVVGDKPLEARYETHVTRIARLVSHGATRIEVAFDEGMIASGNRTRPICEVELELKSGSARDLYEFAAKLAGALPLRLDIVSKAERAYRLGAGTPPPPVKTKPTPLPAALMFDEAIGRVLLGCCEHYIANWAALRDGDDPEAIHQMRVALRRLRAALAMFKRALPCAEFEHFRAQAKDLASALGPARDCDAMREMIVDGPLAHFRGDRTSSDHFRALLEALDARRQEAYAQARATLESSAPSVFVLQLSAFIARRGWRNALSGPQLADVTEPVEDFARDALDRLYKRVLKRGKSLVVLPDEARHEARIALKNLRYGAEFFGACFDDPRGASAFLRGAAHLQNLLGAHNDAASAEQFLGQPHENDAMRAAGLVTGWFARGVVIADEKLAKAWKDFKKTRPFWR